MIGSLKAWITDISDFQMGLVQLCSVNQKKNLTSLCINDSKCTLITTIAFRCMIMVDRIVIMMNPIAIAKDTLKDIKYKKKIFLSFIAVITYTLKQNIFNLNKN